MGVSRSVRALHRQYEGKPEAESVPTRRLSTLESWCRRNDWVERVGMYDEEVQKMLAEEEERALQEGLASAGRRILKLTEIAEQLEQEFVAGMLWLNRVKSIGSGKDGTFERIEEQKFNAQLIKQMRGIYDDIAKETGGRQSKVDITTQGNALQKDFTFVVSSEAEEPEVE